MRRAVPVTGQMFDWDKAQNIIRWDSEQKDEARGNVVSNELNNNTTGVNLNLLSLILINIFTIIWIILMSGGLRMNQLWLLIMMKWCVDYIGNRIVKIWFDQ